jgi:membrane protease YdiL (CAAX protease family)
MLTIKLAAALLVRMLGSCPRFDTEALYALPVVVIISTPVQAGEEIGWRGCALPRLAARYGFARASPVVGLVWACWHLPIFFVHGHGNYGQSFPAFVVGGVALSVAMAWLYVHTHGSLLLVMLMHSAVNQALGVVPSTVSTPRIRLCQALRLLRG